MGSGNSNGRDGDSGGSGEDGGGENNGLCRKLLAELLLQLTECKQLAILPAESTTEAVKPNLTVRSATTTATHLSVTADTDTNADTSVTQGSDDHYSSSNSYRGTYNGVNYTYRHRQAYGSTANSSTDRTGSSDATAVIGTASKRSRRNGSNGNMTVSPPSPMMIMQQQQQSLSLSPPGTREGTGTASEVDSSQTDTSSLNLSPSQQTPPTSQSTTPMRFHQHCRHEHCQLQFAPQQQPPEFQTPSEPLHRPMVVVMAATNRPTDIDPAVLRRFECKINVLPPNTAERAAIFVRYLQQVSHCLTDEQIGQLAEQTDGWTGSEIENFTREAAMAPVRRAFPMSMCKAMRESAVVPLAESKPTSTSTSTTTATPMPSIDPITMNDFSTAWENMIMRNQC